MHRVTALLVTMAALAATDAHSQPTQDKATAEQLFNQARKLMKQNKFAEACPKLEASHKLDPATGTVLNLALCYENTGKLASAWGYYREAVGLDRQQGKNKRAAKAQKRADALKPKIPRLTIVVSAFNRVPGLAIERGGQSVEAALFGVAAYVDEGEYRILAKAPGYQPFSKIVTVDNGERITVEIPALVPDTERNSTTSEGQNKTPTHDRNSDVKPGKNTRRIVGLVAGGTGVAVIAAGLGLGWSARSSWNEPFDSGLCDRDTLLCTPEGQDMTDAAIGRANTATIVFGVGAALVATGVVMYLTAPKHKASKDRLTVIPQASPSSAGFSVIGSF